MKKYVKALISTVTKEHLETIYNQLAPLSVLSRDDKYKLIIASPVISADKKVEFITNLLELTDEKVINLIKYIAFNNRLKELPEFLGLLKDELANLTNDYKGYVYSNETLSESKVAEIESKLSAKFNKNIKLEQKTSNRSGVQVYVESLNVEIAVYEDDIKARLITDIIRAI